MIAFLRASAIGFAALVLPSLSALAEELVTTIAPDQISISSSYSGVSVVAFGVIETGQAKARPYDVVVTVIGPRQSVVARRKERVTGVWINKGNRSFADIPSFLGVFANRPVDQIAGAATLREDRIGLKRVLFTGRETDENEPYLSNLLNIRVDEKLYSEQPRGVTFLSPTAFRVDIPLPQSVLIGDYEVEFKVYSNGVPVVKKTGTFNVAKVGVEEFVIAASTDYSLLYGLATTLMALFMGWLASIVFRKD